MRRFLYILLIALPFAGCRQVEPDNKSDVIMPISICLPANEIHTGGYAPRRIPGDPGCTEQFQLPNYITIIIVKQVGEDWKVWHTINRTVTDEDWEMLRYSGPWQTEGDSVYRYSEEIQLLLERNVNGRVYVVASAEPLDFNADITVGDDISDVLNLTFDASSDNIQTRLQNIYSTPYNYLYNDSYYGSFSSVAYNVQHVNLMLYHVAAKVDIQWNVADTVRIRNNPAEAVRLTYLEARHLFNGNAYCFRPMENTVPSLPVTGYDIPNIVTPTSEGLWWEGRAYFYTIPYTVTGNADYFPLQMRLRTNGSSDTYSPTLNLHVNSASSFVPWLRVNFNLTKPLEDKSETKTVED